LLTATALSATAVVTGCLMQREGDETAGETGVHLRADIGTAVGVQAVRFEIDPADCDSGAPRLDRDVVLVEQPMEGLRAASADFFAPVPAGCYDVSTTPVSTTLACNRVHVQNVAVADGETTEVLLVTQCTGGEAVPPM
jgi:hypothetical protein